MTYGKTMARYQKTNVETATGVDLIIMCYEKCIQFLRQAESHYAQREYEQKAKKLQKALDILGALQGSLNVEKGGQIARNLDALYAYIQTRLLQGDIKEDLTCFEEAIQIMNELKGAWEGISSQSEDTLPGMQEDLPLKTSAAGMAA